MFPMWAVGLTCLLVSNAIRGLVPTICGYSARFGARSSWITRLYPLESAADSAWDRLTSHSEPTLGRTATRMPMSCPLGGVESV